MFLVDTHCHLDLPVFDHDRAAVLERARAVGVQGFVLIGFSPAFWERALALAEATPGMVVALGVHPNEADQLDNHTEQRLRALARHPLVRAIGEIGLDYYWKTVDSQIQQRAFRRQLDLARELELPVILHQREAEHELLTLLEVSDPPHSGVMHCFTGGPELAHAFVALGFHLGIGGIVTFRNAHPLRQAVRDIPSERLLLETDSPYLAPVPHRGQRNEPAFLRYVLSTVAEERGESEEDVAAQTVQNAQYLFRLSLPGYSHDADKKTAKQSEAKYEENHG